MVHGDGGRYVASPKVWESKSGALLTAVRSAPFGQAQWARGRCVKAPLRLATLGLDAAPLVALEQLSRRLGAVLVGVVQQTSNLRPVEVDQALHADDRDAGAAAGVVAPVRLSRPDR